jgi:hypothetical protein
MPGQKLFRVFPEFREGEATAQIVQRPIEFVLIAQEAEKIESEALFKFRFAFEAPQELGESVEGGTELALSRSITASWK